MLVRFVLTKYGSLCKHTKYFALNMQSIAFFKWRELQTPVSILKETDNCNMFLTSSWFKNLLIKNKNAM